VFIAITISLITLNRHFPLILIGLRILNHSNLSLTSAVRRSTLIGILLLFSVINSPAGTGTWGSSVTGTEINYKTTEADSPLLDYFGNSLTVVYLENLGFDKIGGNSNATDVAWLLSKGYRVIELDYAHNAHAVSPVINNDIIAINKAIASGSFCGYTNCSQYRSYILFEGYRIARDVPFFQNDATVYNYPNSIFVDSLRMDIIYPANASVKIPAVLSFSYSNSSAGNANKNQRLNLGYTLAGFNDSFLEGAPASGIAWAIADHPKYCPWGKGKPEGGANDTYKAYEVNPDAAQKVKSAIRTLRSMTDSLGLSGKIGIYGFSRGSDAGSMAIGDKVVPTLEDAGFNIGISDNVQAAALGSGVFDFTQIYNYLDDGDGTLETRCPWAWGPLKDNYELWKSMGSSYLVETAATAPVLFFYNTDDAHYYQDQIKHLKAKLDRIGVPTSTIIDYGTGHAVPQDTASLAKLYTFFNQYLKSSQTGLDDIASNNNGNTFKLPIKLFPNPVNDELKVTYNKTQAGNVQIKLLDLSGAVWYEKDKKLQQIGQQTETINLSKLKLPQGIYFIKVTSGKKQGIEKFFKK